MLYCIVGAGVQSSCLLSNETPALFLNQAYLAWPFILARSSVWQKETSAQWENALIIHDHLTIQDLVCAAYVVFLISARQPHLLMAVSLLLFCILHLQIITTQHAIILFCRPVVGYYNSRQNVFVFVERRKNTAHKLGCVFCPVFSFFLSQTFVRSLWYLCCFFFPQVCWELSWGDFRPTQTQTKGPKCSPASCISFHPTWLLRLTLPAFLLSLPSPFICLSLSQQNPVTTVAVAT